MDYPNAVRLAIPLFILAVLVEMVLWKIRANVSYETRDTAASLTMGVGNAMIGAITGLAIYLLYTWVYQFRLFDIDSGWIDTGWGTILAVFVAQDFIFYWSHRWSHEYRWFWANHVIHHSSQHYNLSTALRQPWTNILTGLSVLGLPLIWLGVSPGLYFFVSGLNLVYQFWIHTEAVDRLGPLEWILNTPSHHRVHHATNPDYLDANYAGTLIIWDRIFGTFVPEKPEHEPPRYGLVKNLGTFNPLRIGVHEYIDIARDVRRARNWREAAAYVFGPPGWSPDGSRRTTAMIREEWRQRRQTAPGSSWAPPTASPDKPRAPAPQVPAAR